MISTSSPGMHDAKNQQNRLRDNEILPCVLAYYSMACYNLFRLIRVQ